MDCEALKRCGDCKQSKPDESFLAGKKKRVSSLCASCRAKRAKRHASEYYRTMDPDKRHTLTHRKRAEAAGVTHEPYSRIAILIRWGYSCAYCWAYGAHHLDHVTPLKLGGADVESNIVPACQSCNLRKGARSLAEWATLP